VPYRLKLLPGVEKQLARLVDVDRGRLIGAMRALASEPRPAGTTHRLENLCRLRVGEQRVVFAVFDAEVVVLICKVARRSEATYRDVRALLRRAKEERASGLPSRTDGRRRDRG
jgi:mRNA-degrading endonuclease RelE of RelBE toxin-antitoxin system